MHAIKLALQRVFKCFGSIVNQCFDARNTRLISLGKHVRPALRMGDRRCFDLRISSFLASACREDMWCIPQVDLEYSIKHGAAPIRVPLCPQSTISTLPAQLTAAYRYRPIGRGHRPLGAKSQMPPVPGSNDVRTKTKARSPYSAQVQRADHCAELPAKKEAICVEVLQ